MLGSLPPQQVHRSVGLALFAIGFGLYARALGFDLLDWDDQVYVVGNPWIREISGRSLLAMFSQPVLGGILPVHLLSYAFDHALWGLDPFGFHLHSLLLNGLNGALAYAVLRRITGDSVVAGVAALLFVVHPSHVSSAVWVAARKELLWTAFLLGSTLAWLRARRDGGLELRFYALSLGLFVLGVASKTTIALYPFFFLALDHFEDRRRPPEQRRGLREPLLRVLPFLALAAPLVALNAWVQTPATEPWAHDLGASLLVKGQAGWRYLWVLIGLMPGQPVYDVPPLSTRPGLVAATLLPLGLPPLACAWAFWRGHANAALALCWGILGMIPPIAFPLITYMADRYLYGPSLGFCWLLALGVVALGRRLVPSGPGFAVGVALLLALPVAQWVQHVRGYTPVWSDSLTLWTHADRRSEAVQVKNGLSAALIRAGRHEEAVGLLEDLPGRDISGDLHLAIAWLSQGRFDQAHEASQRAILRAQAGEPADAGISVRLLWIHGEILLNLGQVEEARRVWELALEIIPEHPLVLAALKRSEAVGSEEGAEPEPGGD